MYCTVVAHIHTIEFQKQGLPHAHVLFVLASEDKPRSPNEIDEFVSAEIPDPATHPILYDLVTKNMFHGPCGNLNLKCSCIVDGNVDFISQENSVHVLLYPMTKKFIHIIDDQTMEEHIQSLTIQIKVLNATIAGWFHTMHIYC
jgi:hypothetical protein